MNNNSSTQTTLSQVGYMEKLECSFPAHDVSCTKAGLTDMVDLKG